jgi:hypothetical protein
MNLEIYIGENWLYSILEPITSKICIWGCLEKMVVYFSSCGVILFGTKVPRSELVAEKMTENHFYITIFEILLSETASLFTGVAVVIKILHVHIRPLSIDLITRRKQIFAG